MQYTKKRDAAAAQHDSSDEDAHSDADSQAGDEHARAAQGQQQAQLSQAAAEEQVQDLAVSVLQQLPEELPQQLVEQLYEPVLPADLQPLQEGAHSRPPACLLAEIEREVQPSAAAPPLEASAIELPAAQTGVFCPADAASSGQRKQQQQEQQGSASMAAPDAHAAETSSMCVRNRCPPA